MSRRFILAFIVGALISWAMQPAPRRAARHPRPDQATRVTLETGRGWTRFAAEGEAVRGDLRVGMTLNGRATAGCVIMTEFVGPLQPGDLDPARECVSDETITWSDDSLVALWIESAQ